MSVSNSDDAQESLEDALRRIFIPEGYYLQAGCIALILYEYLLTVRMEREVIWGRKMTVPTVLFLCNRYTLLLYALTLWLWGLVPWKLDSSCVAPAALQVLCPTLLTAFYTVFSALRIHAINNRRWLWTIIVVLLGSVSIPTNLVGIFWSRRTVSMPHPFTGCAYSMNEHDGINGDDWTRARLAGQVCVIVMDLLVLGITFYRTLGTMMAARKLHMKTSFVSLMLRDGSTFFSLSLGVHVVTIVMNQTRDIMLLLISCTFMSIIVTRFFLNLRMLDASDTETTSYSVHLTHSTTMRFSSSVLGNIGAPLHVGESESNNDDEHDGDENLRSLQERLMSRDTLEEMMGKSSGVLDTGTSESSWQGRQELRQV